MRISTPVSSPDGGAPSSTACSVMLWLSGIVDREKSNVWTHSGRTQPVSIRCAIDMSGSWVSWLMRSRLVTSRALMSAE